MVGMRIIPIDQITDKPNFEWWGFVDVYPWECGDWGIDLRYMFSELDLESSGLKLRVIDYFDLQGEDAEQVSERIRVTMSVILRLDQTGQYVEALHDHVAFYDRCADCGRDDYFVDGLDVSEAWVEQHIVPKLRKSLQVRG
jgi:hypothetical protein